jgi:hypothetical protein
VVAGLTPGLPLLGEALWRSPSAFHRLAWPCPLHRRTGILLPVEAARFGPFQSPFSSPCLRLACPTPSLPSFLSAIVCFRLLAIVFPVHPGISYRFNSTHATTAGSLVHPPSFTRPRTATLCA